MITQGRHNIQTLAGLKKEALMSDYGDRLTEQLQHMEDLFITTRN